MKNGTDFLMDLQVLEDTLLHLKRSSFFLNLNEQKIELLIHWNQKLQELEQQVEATHNYLDNEEQQIEKGRELLYSLEQQNQFLEKMIDSIPFKEFERLPDSQTTTAPVKPTAPSPKPKSVQTKAIKTKIDLITPDEFKTIPGYQIGRVTLNKLNQQLQELNILIGDKSAVFESSNAKSKLQKQMLAEYKELQTEDTKGYFFVTEKELREKHTWSKSAFSMNVTGRNLIVILRSLGRIREIRGGGHNRICIL